MIKKGILGKIYRLKHQKFGDVSIVGKINSVHYKLLLLTKDCLADEKIINLLARWRKKHEYWFPARFKVTIIGTKKWLKEKVIETEDRLLFMIKVKDRYIGHVGLFRFKFTNLTCEIDNIVRGVSLYPGIMTEAIKSMMEWGKKELKLKSYTLETFSHNERSLKLYQRLGFQEYKRVSLMDIKKEDRTDWVEVPKDFKGKIKRYNLFMKLVKYGKDRE